MTPFLSPLLRHGPKLASLLHNTKSSGEGATGSSGVDEGVHLAVGMVMDEMLSELKASDGELIDECMAKVRAKLRVILQEFAEADPNHASFYKDSLSERVQAAFRDDAAAPTQASADSLPNQGAEERECPAARFERTIYVHEHLFCFSFFPSGVRLATRELFNILRGIYSFASMAYPRKEAYLGERLMEVRDEGLLEAVVKSTDLGAHKIFEMGPGVHSRVVRSVPPEFPWSKVALLLAEAEAAEEEFSLPRNPDGTIKLSPWSDILVLLNANQCTLDPKRLAWLPKMERLRVLHLGRFHHHGGAHRILVTDEDLLASSLGRLKQLVVLSLQGVSGITRLPDSICTSLSNLKALDLKGCHDLVYLPRGIDKLWLLEYLDVSRCFYLDHVPKGVALLPYLKVLKGFLISPDNNVEARHAAKASSSCRFSDLKSIKRLVKLSVRTRRMDFPKEQDLETLSCMEELRKLRITWVGIIDGEGDHDATAVVPLVCEGLEKLELEAAPSETAAGNLMSLCRRASKLYIKGGPLPYIRGHHPSCLYGAKAVRLRYLSRLEMHWDEFKRLFPELSVLDVFQCPKLTASFPCDQNGLWRS